MVCPYGASLGPSSCAHWEISPGKELYVIHEQLYCAYMWAAYMYMLYTCTCTCTGINSGVLYGIKMLAK